MRHAKADVTYPNKQSTQNHAELTVASSAQLLRLAFREFGLHNDTGDNTFCIDVTREGIKFKRAIVDEKRQILGYQVLCNVPGKPDPLWLSAEMVGKVHPIKTHDLGDIFDDEITEFTIPFGYRANVSDLNEVNIRW